MKIRKANEKDLSPLIKLYKEIFPVHNVFELHESKIYDYLKKFLARNLLVAEEDGDIIGGLVMTHKKYPKWKLFNLKHVAIAKDHQHKGVGTELLKEAEKIAGKGKIEASVAEDAEAEWAVEFYKKNGYEIEGALKSHYREGETCYIMGKVLG